MSDIYCGVIGIWFPKKHSGFIIPKDQRLKGLPSIFFRAEKVEQELIENPNWPEKGQKVKFSLSKDEVQRNIAVNIRQR